MRSSFDPFGSCSMLIDKMIGNAYEIVEYVAKNMVHVRRASFYMKNIYDASQRLTKVIDLTGPATAGTYVDVELPTLQVESEDGTITYRPILYTDIVGWVAVLQQLDGTLVSESSALFSVKILNTNFVRITLPGGASGSVLSASVKVQISYTLPAE